MKITFPMLILKYAVKTWKSKTSCQRLLCNTCNYQQERSHLEECGEDFKSAIMNTESFFLKSTVRKECPNLPWPCTLHHSTGGPKQNNKTRNKRHLTGNKDLKVFINRWEYCVCMPIKSQIHKKVSQTRRSCTVQVTIAKVSCVSIQQQWTTNGEINNLQ